MSGRLFKNIGFLTFSQAANYVIPLITIPYITRVVGPENYGLIEFATVAMLYFSAVVIYGFNTTATRKIAEAPENMNHVSDVFSTVVVTRLLLFLATTLIFTACLFVIPKFYQEKQLMLFAFPIVLGWALYPDFLFQGLQKLSVVAIANFCVKSVAAILIFVLLKKPEDFYLVLAINASAQILVGLGILLFAFKLVPQLHFVATGFVKIVAQLKEGLYVFLSHFFTRVYTFGTIVFLGFMLSDEQMGLFAAGMKLVIVAQSFLFLPLFGALFPYLTNLFAKDVAAYRVQFKRAMLVMMGVTVFSAGVLMVFPTFFVQLVFGSAYLKAVPFLQIMAPILVVTAISHFSMQQGLIIFKKDKIYLSIIVVVGLLSLPINYMAINMYSLQGAAYSKIAIDGLLAVLGWIYFRKALNQQKA